MGAFTGCQLGETPQHCSETHLCIHVVIFYSFTRIINSIQRLFLESLEVEKPDVVGNQKFAKHFEY